MTKNLAQVSGFSMRFYFLVFLLVFSFIKPINAFQPAVVSANPTASKIGHDILKKGGSAADAAIATAFALSVLEPFNSGIGGGGFLLYYEAKSEKFYFIDYREMAPQYLDPHYLQNHPQELEEGIHSVGIPGFVKGMDRIHHRFRQVSWPGIIEPAIELAKKGIPLRGLLLERLKAREEFLSSDPEFKSIFIDPWQNGKQKIIQKDLAKTLEDIKNGGVKNFYQGTLTQRMIAYLNQEGGIHTLDDFKNYQAFYRKPYEFEVGEYRIISAPLPSSGGRGLNFLFGRAYVNKLHDAEPYSLKSYLLQLKGMKDYFNYRERTLGDVSSNIISHTTHISVIDKEGNIASMTNSLNYPFGAGRIVPTTGIILNNELADFSTNPKVANRIQPNQRPLSSMSPTIIFKDNDPQYVIGTPGGRTIPINIFQTLYAHWSYKLDLEKAVKLPKIYYSPKEDQIIIESSLDKKIKEALNENYQVVEVDAVGNIQALEIKNQDQTKTISDYRGEGRGVK